MDQFSGGGRPELSRVFLSLKSFKNNKLALLSQGQQHYAVSSVYFLLINVKKAIFSKIMTVSLTSIRFTFLLIWGQRVNRVAKTQNLEPKFIFN